MAVSLDDIRDIFNPTSPRHAKWNKHITLVNMPCVMIERLKDAFYAGDFVLDHKLKPTSNAFILRDQDGMLHARKVTTASFTWSGCRFAMTLDADPNIDDAAMSISIITLIEWCYVD